MHRFKKQLETPVSQSVSQSVRRQVRVSEGFSHPTNC